MSFELAQKVADAVLYEGYVLYPYRASAAKNRLRWQFGVVVPRGYSELGGSEPWAMQTEILVEPGALETSPELDLRVRFLQVQARTIEKSLDAEGSSFHPVETLDVEDRTLVTWEEGVERHLDATVPLATLLDGEQQIPLELPEWQEDEVVRTGEGAVAARIVRERWPVSALVRLAAEPSGNLVKVRVRIENVGAWDGETDRERALRRSLIGAHTLLAVRGGAFVSLLDPPPETAEAASACANQHTWPVLIGTYPARDVLLSSPIILYDYPAVAAESLGDLCDSTEIDEILTLRVMTLTDEEKREARGTDERSRQIIERSDSIPPELFERLHGAVRPISGSLLAEWESFLNPPGVVPPEEASIEIGAVRVAQGTRVRLRPSRRADSMDLFLAGRVARVQGIYRDVEDVAYVAVSLEDDQDEEGAAGDLHSGHGRFFYFYPDEVEPLESDTGEPWGSERRSYGATPVAGRVGIGRGGAPDPVAAGPGPLSEDPPDVESHSKREKRG